MSDTSGDLIARWRNGDQQAAAELIRRYTSRLIALARSRLPAKLTRRVDPEDVVQSVYRSFFAGAADGLRLDGEWRPLAVTKERPFAGPANARFATKPWAESFSHGELLRAGNDERLEVDPARLRFLFQGVSDADRKGKKYGEIPWRLGLLEPAGP